MPQTWHFFTTYAGTRGLTAKWRIVFGFEEIFSTMYKPSVPSQIIPLASTMMEYLNPCNIAFLHTEICFTHCQQIKSLFTIEKYSYGERRNGREFCGMYASYNKGNSSSSIIFSSELNNSISWTSLNDPIFSENKKFWTNASDIARVAKPTPQNFFKLCKKLHLIMLITIW